MSEFPEQPGQSRRVDGSRDRQRGEKPPRQPPSGLWIMTLILTALIAGPLLYQWIPHEISRWYVAAAMENRASGKTEQAYENMQRALDWHSQDPMHYLQRAEWRREDGKYEAALADCNKAIELGGETASALIARSQVYQHLSRHGAAIADWKKLDRLSETTGTPDRANALNGLAYARAVGKLELDEGLQNIEEAMHLQPNSAALIDTRGYLRYLTGDLSGAISDMETAVTQIEAIYSQEGKQIKKSDKANLTDEQRRQLEQLKQLKQSVAVIRYHRALVYEKLDREKDAKADLARVKELIGREADETLF